jgi:hypothetical protein
MTTVTCQKPQPRVTTFWTIFTTPLLANGYMGGFGLKTHKKKKNWGNIFRIENPSVFGKFQYSANFFVWEDYVRNVCKK